MRPNTATMTSIGGRPGTATMTSSATGMTSAQRAVLRRKKAYIAESVVNKDEFIDEIKAAGLISEDTFKDLRVRDFTLHSFRLNLR